MHLLVVVGQAAVADDLPARALTTSITQGTKLLAKPVDSNIASIDSIQNCALHSDVNQNI
jgi:hypothetical protein